MKLLETKQLASDVITHDVTPLTVNTNARGYSKLGWFIVIVGVLGFFLWATFAPLDKGVPMPGTVAREGNRKAVQYLSGGIVDDILVREGDQVKKGQVLVRMNRTQAASQLGITKVQLITASAMVARLSAERDSKASFDLPAELEPFKDDPQVAQTMALQKQLFSSRQQGLRSSIDGLNESIAGLNMQLGGLTQSRDAKKEQLAIVREQLQNIRDLAKDGYVPRAKLLEQERLASQLNGEIAEEVGNIGRTQHQITELELKRGQMRDDYQKEVRTQLSDAEREARALGSRMTAEQYALDNVDVKAPVDGMVVGLAVFTRGGVVQPGFRMMEIVPMDDGLVIEGRLAVNLVDKVRVNMPADLIFPAFNTNTTPHIPGKVTVVSADRLIDEHSGQPYYVVQAKVSPEGVKLMQAKHMDVRAGMPVEMFVKTGERSMISYLLKPVFDRAKTSMAED